MRAAVRAGLWATLSMSGVGAVAAQTDTDSVRAITREKLWTLLSTYPPARAMQFHRGQDPFVLEGSIIDGLRHAASLHINAVVRQKQVITLRIYPSLFGPGPRININRVRNATGLMQKLLEHSYHDFFYWGADDSLHVFAGFTFTLESGFPDEAIRVVISSIPLLDQSVGELEPWLE